MFKLLKKNNHKFFGQHGEDFLIWSLFEGDHNGFYVDVGAFDGIHLSNSYSFEIEGWHGVCVEAHPEYFQMLQKNRPLCQSIHAACVHDPTINSVEFLSEPLGLLSGIEAFKTPDMEKRYAARGMTFPGWCSTKVPAMTLTKILELTNAPHEISFLSIDVEGTEINVLTGLNLNKYSIRLIITESNSAEDATALAKYLDGYGYMPARQVGVNTFFVRSESDCNKISNIKGRVKIEDTLHPRGEKATLKQTRGRILKF
jgi:FkbM family methyltransferase